MGRSLMFVCHAQQRCLKDCRQRIFSGMVVSQHPRRQAFSRPSAATLSISGCPRNRGNSNLLAASLVTAFRCAIVSPFVPIRFTGLPAQCGQPVWVGSWYLSGIVDIVRAVVDAGNVPSIATGVVLDGFVTCRCGCIPTWVGYAPLQVSYGRCAGIHMEWMPWASGKHRFTKELMVTLAEWSRTLPWRQVPTLFGCAWGTVAAAVEEAVAYGLAQRDLSELTHVGIDEISRSVATSTSPTSTT